MLNLIRRTRRERCCRQCFAYIPYDSRKCEFCGYRYKPAGFSLFDKIRQAFKVDRVYKLEKVQTGSQQTSLFTLPEIEYMLKPSNIRIRIFLILDDLTNLDEMALIELGETLSMVADSRQTNPFDAPLNLKDQIRSKSLRLS